MCTSEGPQDVICQHDLPTLFKDMSQHCRQDNISVIWEGFADNHVQMQTNATKVSTTDELDLFTNLVMMINEL
jgi:hypothetical protein